MFVVLVEFETKPEHCTDFASAVQMQSRNSLGNETDCHVFDICRDPDNENRFVLYEVYSDREAFEHHLKSAHFIDFDSRTGQMIANKSVRILNRMAAP